MTLGEAFRAGMEFYALMTVIIAPWILGRELRRIVELLRQGR